MEAVTISFAIICVLAMTIGASGCAYVLERRLPREFVPLARFIASVVVVTAASIGWILASLATVIPVTESYLEGALSSASLVAIIIVGAVVAGLLPIGSYLIGAQFSASRYR